MKSTIPENWSRFEDKSFLALLIAISLAFAVILWPFYGAVLWAIVLAVVFAPLYRRLLSSLRQRRTLAALATVSIIVLIVLLPLAVIIASLVREASSVYTSISSGQLNLGRYFQQLLDALPAWATHLLDRLGLSNLGSAQERLSAGVAKGSQFILKQAVNFGQNTFDFLISLFVMLYLLFFLFRDGARLAQRLKEAIPLRAEQKRALFNKATAVIRATVKGNIVVAVVQGLLGGIIFWILRIHAPLLWGVVMAVLSLLPAIGSALIWLPVALYLLITGSALRGLVLLAYGILVISLVDNFLRPILVGKDTKLPDYVVLISTLGGIAVFGINGLVLGPVIAALFIAAWDIFIASE